MKKLISILVALVMMTAMSVTPLVAAGSTGSNVTGKWTSWKKGELPFELKLESSGSTLTGTVRVASGPAVAIYDATMAGSRITFKAVVPNGDGTYPMMFTGRHSGSRIDFKCDVEVNVPGEKTEFGPACVARISVRRAAR